MLQKKKAQDGRGFRNKPVGVNCKLGQPRNPALGSEPVPSAGLIQASLGRISAQLSASGPVHWVFGGALLQARSEVPF